MKKLVVGCLSIFAVLLIAGGAIVYVTVWRPAQQFVGVAQNIAKIESLDRQVRNQRPFHAPEENILNAMQVESYLRVQEGMQRMLEHRFATLQEKYAELDASNREPTFQELLAAWSDIALLVTQAKEAQVAALNAEGLSVAEYVWLREQVLLAVGYAAVDFDFMAALQQQAPDAHFAATTVNQANVTLVAPYRERLEPLLGFAFFGL